MAWATLIPVLAALAGAFIGGLVAESRTALELRRERRKALNRVLWTQLDLWYEVGRSDPSAFFDLFLTGLRKRLGASEEELAPLAQQKGIVSTILRQVLEDDRNEQLEVQYTKAVDSLADFDPILAFRLSGKSAFARHREQSDTYLEKLLQHYGQTDLAGASTGVEMMRPFMQRETSESALKTLREDIEEVAEQLGRRSRHRVIRLLSDLQRRAENDQQQVFEDYMDRATQQVLTMAAKASAAERGVGGAASY